MKHKAVVTTDKNEFLKKEREWFPSMSDEEYIEQMEVDAVKCSECNVFYWDDCLKRCRCGKDMQQKKTNL